MTESTEPPGPPDGMQFNAPPGWPPPPPGWVPGADFQPDPSWPAAPPDWHWWVPAGDSFRGSTEVTAVIPTPGAPESPAAPPPGPGSHPGPAFVPGPPSSGGPDYTAGPYPPAGPPGPSGQQSSWVRRHRLLTAALVVVGLLALGGVGTAGAVILANRGDDKPANTAGDKPAPGPSSSLAEPSPQPSGSESADPNSAEHKAACNKAAAPNNKALDLVKGYTTKSMTNPAIIAAIPPVQADLTAAADTASGVLERDLREYAAALGAFRSALMQNRDGNTAAAKVLIYSIVLKAACGL